MKEIRNRLRLVMNGVTSSAMKEKGIRYKLNFGVDIPNLRRMAKDYTPGLELAETLWKEDVRELKILATMLCPAENFKNADIWVKEIDNLELAEQACMNCFSKLPDAVEKAMNWILSTDFYVKLSGYLLCARLFSSGFIPDSQQKEQFYRVVFLNIQDESLHLRNAAVVALKRLGRQSLSISGEILEILEKSGFSDPSLKKALIEDIKFEFDYYL